MVHYSRGVTKAICSLHMAIKKENRRLNKKVRKEKFNISTRKLVERLLFNRKFKLNMNRFSIMNYHNRFRTINKAIRRNSNLMAEARGALAAYREMIDANNSAKIKGILFICIDDNTII